MKSILLTEERSELRSLSMNALKVQMKLYEVQEWALVLAIAVSASILRVAMQGLPNIEPLTFAALLGGALLGWRKGLVVGASSVWMSNYFVVGGQGPWSVFQVVSYAGIGVLGSMLPKKAGVIRAVTIAIVASVWFELTMNMSWAALSGINPAFIFLAGLPFFAMHLVGNVSFSLLLPSIRRKLNESAHLDDRELCRTLIDSLTRGNRKTATKASKL